MKALISFIKMSQGMATNFIYTTVLIFYDCVDMRWSGGKDIVVEDSSASLCNLFLQTAL